MLTKIDIEQLGKLVRKVVREEIEAEVKDASNNLENQVRLSRIQIQNDVREIDDRMKNVEIRLDEVNKKVTDVKKKVSKMDKTLTIVARNYDEADVKLQRRVRKLEQHLAIPE